MQRQRGIDPKPTGMPWIGFASGLDTIYSQVRLYKELTKGLYSLEPSAVQGCYSRIELASRRAREGARLEIPMSAVPVPVSPKNQYRY